MRRVVAGVATVLLVLLGTFGPSNAQGGDYLLLLAYTCESDPGSIGGGFGVMPEDCGYAPGVSFTVTDATGGLVGGCTTEIGGCSVQVPLGTTITVTEVVSTVATGYAPIRNPILVNTPEPPGYAGEWMREFINVAVDATGASPDTPVEVVDLPNTGAGAVALGDLASGRTNMAMLALVLGVAICVLGRRAYAG